MSHVFTRFATLTARAAGHPLGLSIALGVVFVWAITGPIFGFSDTWQLVINTGTTIVTFLMVFLIQNSQNREGAAIQAKLDEIIRSVDNARNEFIGVEHLSQKELEEVLKAAEESVAEATREDGPEAVERLRQSLSRLRGSR